MATEVAFATGVLPSTLTSVDITSAGFGTPDAAILVFSNAGNNNPITSLASFGFGFVDSSDNEITVCISSNGGEDPTESVRQQMSTKAVVVPKSYTTPTPTDPYIEADGELIANGVRLTVTEDNTGATRQIGALLIKGITNSTTFSEVLSTSSTTNDITSIGFEPDFVFLCTVGEDGEVTFSQAILNFGVVHKNSSGTISQAHFGCFGENDVSTTNTGSIIESDYCVGQYFNSSYTWKAAAGSFDSNGFTLTTNTTNTGGDIVFGLALKLADPDDGYVDIVDLPGSTASQAYSGLGFAPDAIGILATMLTAESGSDGTGMCVGFGDSSAEISVSFYDENGTGAGSSGNEYDSSNIVNLKSSSGSQEAEADISSLDSDGFTLAFSDQLSATRKALVFAFGDSTAGGAIEAALSFSADLSATPVSQADIQGALALSSVNTAALAKSAIYESGLGLNSAQSAISGGTATVFVSVALTIDDAITQTAEIGTGAQTFEAALSIGLVQTVESLTVANLFAAITLEHQAAITIAGGSDVEAAISYALTHDFVTAVSISIEGAVGLAVGQTLTNSVQQDLSVSTALAHQVSLQTVASAVIESGLDLTAIKSVSVQGFTLVVGIVTPDCRKITITVQDLTISPGEQDRTITIPEC